MTLPKALILDQSSLANVCTRIQFAAHECPKDSIYGYATADSPLLDGPLKGPVYLRSSDNELPDMLAALRGQVNIGLAGRIDSVKGRLRNTFDVVPDVPVSKFALTVSGGKTRPAGQHAASAPANTRRSPLHRPERQEGEPGPKLRTSCKKHQKASTLTPPSRASGAQIGWLRRPDQDLVDVDARPLLEGEHHRPGDVVVAAAPTRRAGCRRRACRSSPARSG